jgi:rhamnose transport system permease protein
VKAAILRGIRPRRLLERWETALVVLLLVAGVWGAYLSPFFLYPGNLLDLMTPSVAIGFMALGLTLVVVAGEIDISGPSILAVSSVVFALLWSGGMNIGAACLVAMAVGAGLGLLNGLLVAALDLPSLAVTLGTLAAFRGLAFILQQADSVSGFPQAFSRLGSGYVWQGLVPIPLLLFLCFAAVLAVLLHGTRLGRYIYTIGANREAAVFSGVPVRRVRVLVFVLSGWMASLGGLIYAGFFASVRADIASNDLLDVVTGVVLGGVNIFGGSGSVAGVVIALFLIATARNGMSLANIPGPTQDIFIGVLLLTAIILVNSISRLRESRAASEKRPAQTRVEQSAEVKAIEPEAVRGKETS